ncbi:MAG: hypothetical protein IJF02_00110 [Oscillospiraceae bacterium]|nr:hypothetical protein [Oscillospiraceae bacterium]
MKVFSVIIKILVALAAVAGAVYIAATYGDKIVAWAKKLLGSCKCCCECECDCDCECECDDVECECCCCEEAAEEITEAAEAPAAEESATEADFEG